MTVLEKDRKKSHNADYVVCIPKPLNAGAGKAGAIFSAFIWNLICETRKKKTTPDKNCESFTEID